MLHLRLLITIECIDLLNNSEHLRHDVLHQQYNAIPWIPIAPVVHLAIFI